MRVFCSYVHSMNQTYAYSRYDRKIKFRMVSAQHFINEAPGLETYLATPSPSHSASSARQLSSWWCVWGGCYVGKQFLKGGHHLLLQNVTVHVEIHVSLNEPQLPSTSSSHAAPDHDATTTMLDCRQGTIFTCWTPSESNKFTLDSSDHRTWFQ